MDHDAMKCPRCEARPYSPCNVEWPKVVYLCQQRRHMNEIAREGVDPYSGAPETIFEQQLELVGYE